MSEQDYILSEAWIQLKQGLESSEASQQTAIPALILKDGSSLVTTDAGKAQLLNDFYHSCFNHPFNPLSDPDPLDPSSCPSDLLCTENQITDLLLSLNTAKSTGTDNNLLLCCVQLLPPLHPVLQNCSTYLLHLAVFPLAGNVQEELQFPSLLIQLYLQITVLYIVSILPNVSKVFECHIYNLIYQIT